MPALPPAAAADAPAVPPPAGLSSLPPDDPMRTEAADTYAANGRACQPISVIAYFGDSALYSRRAGRSHVD